MIKTVEFDIYENGDKLKDLIKNFVLENGLEFNESSYKRRVDMNVHFFRTYYNQLLLDLNLKNIEEFSALENKLEVLDVRVEVIFKDMLRLFLKEAGLDLYNNSVLIVMNTKINTKVDLAIAPINSINYEMKEIKDKLMRRYSEFTKMIRDLKNTIPTVYSMFKDNDIPFKKQLYLD